MTLLDVPERMAAAAIAPAGERRRGIVVRRFLRNPGAVLGATVLLALVTAITFAPRLAPTDPTGVDPAHALEHASRRHPLGTDLIGRDVLSRILYGGRTSLLAAVAASAGVAVIGLLLGVVSGLMGGLVDTLVMRLVDIVQSLPLLIVAMVAVGLLGGGTDKLVLTVVLLGWTGHARVVRAVALGIRERGFVRAARAMGSTRMWIMVRHVVPGVVSTLATLSMIELGRFVLVLSALSFLGFGVRPPNPEWGAMLADNRTSFFLAPRLLMYPGIAITTLVVSVNLIGDGLRDAFERRD